MPRKQDLRFTQLESSDFQDAAQRLGQKPTEHNTASNDTKENTKVPRQSELKRSKPEKGARPRRKTTSKDMVSIDTISQGNGTAESELESALQVYIPAYIVDFIGLRYR